MIEILFIFSALINCLLVWYIIQLIRRFINFQEMLDTFVMRLEEYEGHVDIIYNLERFYGDDTLKNLLTHSKTLVEESQKFRTLVLPLEEETEEETEEMEDVDGSET